MNTNLLTVVTPPPDICHGFSTQNKSWEVNFTPVNVKSCGRRNVRKFRQIKKGERYIALDIYVNPDCMDNRELTS